MSSQRPQADSVSAHPTPSDPPGITDPGDGQAGHGSEDVEPLDTPSDVLEVRLRDKTVVLVGTAHVSRESAELVRRVIEARKPDRVCVELDEKRLETLARQRQWESLDLRALIRTKRLSALLAALLLHSYQKRLGDRLGVIPGMEMLEAVRTAEALGIPLALCDRDIRVTMRRAWRATPFLQKGLLVSALLYSIFDTTEMSEETLRKLRQQDVISEVMRELGEEVPSLKRVLVDERDIYLAHRIREAEGRLVVAVVGAGHVEGIRCRLLQEPAEAPAPSLIAELDTIPPMRPIWKWVGWALPAIILGSIAWIGFQKGAEAAWANAQYWVLANGIPSAMGAILAAAHPATILTAFLAAPLTSLTPVIGVGYVVAFVQAYVQPPVVREFQTVADDIGVLRQWWRNRLLRILLAFVLTTLGSVLGTWVGGTAIIANLF